jgi:hypothetical protein
MAGKTEAAPVPAPETVPIADAHAHLETRLITIDPRRIHLLEKNARYMTAPQFARLVANIKRDGKLTSVPLVYPVLSEEEPEALSGNHRVQAAIEAGLLTIDAMLITTPLTEGQRLAVQLSHNAIAGQDDPNILKELYDPLDFDLKEYSGLTDDDFKVAEVDVSSLALGNTAYEELVLLFLPDEMIAFTDLVARLEKRSKHPPVFLARHADFDTFFAAAVATKKHLNVFNNALALRRMAELALERLEEMDAEADADASVADSDRNGES